MEIVRIDGDGDGDIGDDIGGAGHGDGSSEVTLAAHTVFEATGEHLSLPITLAFRSRARLESDLAAAGFTVHRVDGGWDRRPVGPSSGLLIVAAERGDPPAHDVA